MCLIPLKPEFYVFLPRKRPPKLTLGKNSCVNFCKLAQITKEIDTFKQVVPPLSSTLATQVNNF